MKWWFIVLGLVGILSIAGVGILVIKSNTASSITRQPPDQTTKTVRNISVTINPPSDAAATTTLTFVGDVMLDRYVRTTIGKNSPGWPFEKIQDELNGDGVIGNLEGPITNNASVATNTHLVFTFDPKHIPGLTSAGFTHFSLANNHTLNFGQAGLTSTRDTLTNNALKFFGDPSNRTGFAHTETIKGKLFTFIGYHGLVAGRDTIVNEVKTAHDTGAIVIVMPHWGNEYQAKASAKQINDARALIDAGADLIIGAHPHVIQPIEVYQGKMIFYSLGNFLFDQYFSEPTQRGLLVRLTIDDDVVTAALVPIAITSGQVQLPTTAERDTILATIAKDSTVDEILRKNIAAGRITLPLLP